MNKNPHQIEPWFYLNVDQKHLVRQNMKRLGLHELYDGDYIVTKVAGKSAKNLTKPEPARLAFTGNEEEIALLATWPDNSYFMTSRIERVRYVSETETLIHTKNSLYRLILLHRGGEADASK